MHRPVKLRIPIEHLFRESPAAAFFPPMETPLTVIVCLLAVFTAALLAYRAGRLSVPVHQAEPEKSDVAPAAEEAPEAPEPPKDIHALAADLDDLWSKAPTLEGARRSTAFREAVAAVATAHGDEDLLGFARRGEAMVAVLALEALATRETTGAGRFQSSLVARIDSTSGIHREHAFTLLHESARGPVVPPVLAMIHRNLCSWDDAEAAEALREFIDHRKAAGEAPTFGKPMPKLSSWDRSNFEDIFRRLPDELADPLREEMKGAGGEGKWQKFLAGFARLLEPVGDTLDDGSPLVGTPALDKAAERLADMLAGGDTIQPPLLIGDEGCGKSALIRLVVKHLQQAGYTVFEASGPDIVSGQCYLGDLEKRVRSMIEALENEKFVWLVPSLADLVHAGKTRSSEAGVLDLVMPALQRGGTRVLAEVRPGVLDKLLGEAPRIASAMTLVRIDAPGPAESIAMVAEWLARHRGERTTTVKASAAQLGEALMLAGQYFPGPALPGRLFKLVRAAFHHAVAAGGGARELDRGLLLESIAAATGMPIELLDENRPLGLDTLRGHFSASVMGQPEAVDALVARLAMMKAGVTDPTRPLGVFLFAGPTGTGKTELAKCLSTYLFGSPDRMLRIDMSEIRSGTLDRLTGAPSTGEANSLASRIRQQPFAVILLDEFEKADPAAWDLFLQVFDDGRLTDAAGNTADFRQSIIILTSNLGAKVAQGVPLGFGAGAAAEFRAEEIDKAIAEAFRPEFVNRIDRVLCFRPLSRDTMRAILSAELRKALGRRGLRQRPWVIEIDATATDFLLDKGFSPTLGARPLQRAIDRHLLGPMAEAVVRGELPDAEDLVFIYAKDGRLRWDLASGEIPALATSDPGELPSLTLRQMALGPAGSREEIDALRGRLVDLTGLIELESFHQRRANIFESMAGEGFWNSPGRFAILGEAEYLDRIESATRSASKTVERLASQPAGGPAIRSLVSKMALRLHLLENAWHDAGEGKSSAAWIALQPMEDTPKCTAFAAALAGMIEGWASQRDMDIKPLAIDGWQRAWSVEGFAALRILEAENGLHIAEEGGLGETARVQIAVAAQIPGPESLLPGPISVVAAKALHDAHSREIVRRYQDRPTPLVRDRRRNFRTGRLDLVLAGHFDLMNGA
jgi:ATP-dependent Clp protease ATP-binding subunit ClpC